MVSRVMAAIVSKKRQMTSSRLVSTALLSISKLSGAKSMLFFSAMARLPANPSVIGLLCRAVRKSCRAGRPSRQHSG